MAPVTTKLQIACELLDRSLRLYSEGGSDFAALHLAGAAEELLGRYLKKMGGEASFDSMRQAVNLLLKGFDEDGKKSKIKAVAKVINDAKNSTKHMNGKDTNDEYISFEPRMEAEDIIDRALSNYYQLIPEYKLPETEAMRRFGIGRKYRI